MAQINLIGNLAVVQGKTFQLTTLWEGDISTWTARAKIRDNYKYEAGTELAAFAFLPLVYPVPNTNEVDCTSITMVLPAAVTEDLFVTKYQGREEDLRIGRAFVWDLEIVSPDDEVRGLEAGWVQVKPEVT